MDLVWVSKVLITITIYFLLNLAYKKIDWHSRKLDKGSEILMVIIMSISFIPLCLAFFLLFYLLIIHGLFTYLDTKKYWEQIMLIYGFIALYYFIRIKIDELDKKKEKREELIHNQIYQIMKLENEIKKLKNKD